MPPSSECDIGLIGLGVMGRNLALNIADHGYRIGVYNRSAASTREFAAASNHDNVAPYEDLASFVAALARPRIVILLVPAGKPVDLVCEALIEAGVEPDDIVVDGGNSLWTDTIRREKDYRGKLTFFGSGVSGGELGARFGPSLMPGGDPNAWQRLRPIWEAIAAKVDPLTGREVETSKGQNVETSTLEPCTAYIGPDGAGHYVKMVHNGIEYADMQLICEAYHLLRECLHLSPKEIGDVFAKWNEGDLDSFLIEITADILRQNDPVTGAPFVDVVLDRAAQKGTGKWTAVNALDMGTPAMTIAEAVFARAMSAIKEERVAASSVLKGPRGAECASDAFIEQVRDALYCSKVCAYAQGFQLMAAAQGEYNWQFNFGEIAKIWRGGCIIRAAFLQKITEAYQREPNLANLVLDSYFRERIATLQDSWRSVVARAAKIGVPVPAFGSALAYYDSYRCERLPANLLQAQRDYFGAHTYERVDQPRGKHFHLDWPHPERPQAEV